MKFALALFLCALAGFTHADVVEFVPPNDPVGLDYGGANNAYSVGRGIVFRADQAFQLTSVGFYHNLQNVDVTYKVSQVSSELGVHTGPEVVLFEATETVSTTELSWIDFSVGELYLDAGSFYIIEFTHFHSELGMQNFFYFNDNERWSQDGFSLIDGIASEFAANSVAPAVRVDVSVVPVPTAVWLFGSGLLGLGFLRRT